MWKPTLKAKIGPPRFLEYVVCFSRLWFFNQRSMRWMISICLGALILCLCFQWINVFLQLPVVLCVLCSYLSDFAICFPSCFKFESGIKLSCIWYLKQVLSGKQNREENFFGVFAFLKGSAEKLKNVIILSHPTPTCRNLVNSYICLWGISDCLFCLVASQLELFVKRTKLVVRIRLC